MKIRTGFVSNSSSASFVVSLDRISAKDLCRLFDYSKLEPKEGEYMDYWDITVNYDSGLVHGWTSMDNDYLREYLEKHGVNIGLFSWEGD